MTDHRSRIARRIALWASAAAVAIAPSLVVLGDARADDQDPDAARITAARHSLKWNWVPPGHGDRYGHAETLIHAPIASVRKNIQDYGHYTDFLPARFKASRVVGHEADRSTDVYVQISVLNGVLALWNVSRFSAPHETSPGVEVIEGRMIPGRGNVDDMDAVWTVRALGDEWTVLKFDLLLKPGIPAPQSILDEELRDCAMFAVDKIHDKAQGTPGIAQWPSPAGEGPAVSGVVSRSE